MTGPRGADGGLRANRFGGVAGRAADGTYLVSLPDQVRNMPSWPRSWANSILLWLYSCRNAWAIMDLLGQPNTFLALAGCCGGLGAPGA